MQRKMVTQRIDSADQVDAVFAAHGADLAAQLAEHYAPADGGPPPFDYQAHLDHLRGDLATTRQELAAASSVHQMKLGEVIELRSERDRQHGEEYGAFKIVRQTVEGVFGREKGFPLAGVSGNTPRQPKRLALQMRQTADFLAGRSRALPAIEIGGLQMDPAAMATDLGDRADGLSQLLVTLDRERKASQGTQKVKDRAQARFDDVFLWVSRILENLFNLVGEHELAAQVRPSLRRPGRRAVDVGETDEAPAPEQDQGDDAPSEA